MSIIHHILCKIWNSGNPCYRKVSFDWLSFIIYLMLVVCNKKGSCWNNNSEHYITSYILLEQGLKLQDTKLTLKMFI